MKKLIILSIILGGISGCAHKKTPSQNIIATPSSPFDVSLNRELYYESVDTINPSLFGFKQLFSDQEGDFNPTKTPSNSRVINKIITHAYSLVGKPYVYGGESVIKGFDCSGFVGYLYDKEAGISLPRSTRQMIKLNAPNITKSKLKPGDVLFFATNRGRQVSHTGIYVGNHYFIHASNHRKGVRIDSLNNNYWNASFVEAKRIVNNI